MKDYVFAEALGRFLRLKRLEQDKTLEKIASIAHINDKNLGRIERGEKIPKAHTLFRIFIALNLTKHTFDDILELYEFLKNEKDM
ncbi:helix-turn-helix domain-containing protein [Alteribacillus sp. YIM 98480]|uniref:helix-turn-helix domain-containing protein n=1 Tax=Alteribacillus sp. YIM 98480 TaxID=2606599 RepID=UPI00131A69A6|nr:helix-turn-helix transcriptional regulator [Alteribacillus sp. YIM 98480]